MWIVCQADDSHEISLLIFCEKNINNNNSNNNNNNNNNNNYSKDKKKKKMSAALVIGGLRVKSIQNVAFLGPRCLFVLIFFMLNL